MGGILAQEGEGKGFPLRCSKHSIAECLQPFIVHFNTRMHVREYVRRTSNQLHIQGLSAHGKSLEKARYQCSEVRSKFCSFSIHICRAVSPYNIRYTRICIYTYIYVYDSMWPYMSYSLGKTNRAIVYATYTAYNDIRLSTRSTRNCVGGGLIQTHVTFTLAVPA
jgi:hypothetical protein